MEKWLPVLRLERFRAGAVRWQLLSFSLPKELAIICLGKASQSSPSQTDSEEE